MAGENPEQSGLGPERELARVLLPRAAAFAEYAVAWKHRVETRSRQLVEGALDETGLDAETFLRRVGDDEQLSVLFAMAIDAAQRAYSDAKVRGLARALASAVNDNAQVDESQLMAATISSLEVVHVRALALLREVEGTSREGVSVEGKTPASALEPMHLTPEARQVVLATLSSHGLFQEREETQVTWGGGTPLRSWSVTKYGRAILELLKDWRRAE